MIAQPQQILQFQQQTPSRMGNIHGDSAAQPTPTSCRRSAQEPFRMEQWELRRKKNQYDVYKHRRDSREVEVYTVEIPLGEDISGYELRKQGQFCGMPRVLHYESLNSNNGYLCQQTSRLLRVVLQRIPLRLGELKQLPRSAESILLEALESYQLIHSRFGATRVAADMIGFTELGATKVWMNCNFARNEPDSSDKMEVPENYMVEGIFTVFDSYLKGSLADRKKYMTFSDAIAHVKEKLLRKFGSSTQHPPQELKQSIRPINYILVRNAPKKVQIDLAEQQPLRGNFSGISQRPDERTELRKTNFNYSGTGVGKVDTVHSVLAESRGIAKPLNNPRHAINQLAGLTQTQTHSDIENSPHHSTQARKQQPAQVIMGSSVAPTVIRHIDASLGVTTKPNVISNTTISPPRAVIKIPANSMNAEPVYFPKQQTVHFSFESAQEKLGRQAVDRRVVLQTQLPADNNRYMLNLAQSKKSETLRDHTNTSNNSGSSYKQPVITFNLGKPIASVSPQHTQPSTVASQTPASINRNINIRPRLRQTRYHTTTEHLEDEDMHPNQTLVTKPSMKAIKIDDRQYKPIQIIKATEKRSVGKPVELYRPGQTALREGSEPKISFNYTNPAISSDAKENMRITTSHFNVQPEHRERMADRNNSAKRLDAEATIDRSTQQHEALVESKAVPVQKDDIASCRSTRQFKEEMQMKRKQLYHTGKKLEELKPLANKIQSERLKDQPSTDFKLHGTDKKTHKDNSIHSGSIMTKCHDQETPEAKKHQVPTLKLEYDQDDSCRKQPPALNTEIRPSIKVVYSYLEEDPLRITNTVRQLATHLIEPLPLQKISEPRLISQSDHSFPEPQPELIIQADQPVVELLQEPESLYNRSIDMNTEDQRKFEEEAYYIEQPLNYQQAQPYYGNQQQPSEVPFYSEVCDYYENNESNPEQEQVPASHPHAQDVKSLTIPAPTNVIPQKVSTSSLKDEVAAVLYDEHDYEHLQPNKNISDLYYQHIQYNGRYPSKNTSATINNNPAEQRNASINRSTGGLSPSVKSVGIGFNIMKRQTTSRIKQILAQEKSKRQDKQHPKNSYEKLLAQKRDVTDDLTQYLQKKLEERQRIQQERYKEEEERKRQAEYEAQKQQWVAEENQPPSYEEELAQGEHQDEQVGGGGFYSDLHTNLFQEDEERTIPTIPNEYVLAGQHQEDEYAQEMERYLVNEGRPGNHPHHPAETSHRHYEHYPVAYEQPPQFFPPNFGIYSNLPSRHHNSDNRKQLSYDDLRADLKNLLKSSTHVQIEGGSRRSSKEKTIEQKIRQKKSNFAGLKQQAARVLGL